MLLFPLLSNQPIQLSRTFKFKIETIERIIEWESYGFVDISPKFKIPSYFGLFFILVFLLEFDVET